MRVYQPYHTDVIRMVMMQPGNTAKALDLPNGYLQY